MTLLIQLHCLLGKNITRFHKALRQTPACVTERWMEPLKPPDIFNQLGADAPVAPSLVFPISQLYRMLPSGRCWQETFYTLFVRKEAGHFNWAPHHPEFYWLVSATAVSPLTSSCAWQLQNLIVFRGFFFLLERWHFQSHPDAGRRRLLQFQRFT